MFLKSLKKKLEKNKQKITQEEQDILKPITKRCLSR